MPKSSVAIQPKRTASAPKRSMKFVQVSWMFAHAAAPRYRQGEARGTEDAEGFASLCGLGRKRIGCEFGKEHHGCRLMAGPTAYEPTVTSALPIMAAVIGKASGWS